MVRRRILVVTTEVLPPFAAPCAGGGVRAWQLGETLRAAGHEVAYALPRSVLEDKPLPDDVAILAYDNATLSETVVRQSPDLLVFEQWYPLTHLDDVGVPVALDLPGPLMLENWYRGVGEMGPNALAKLRALAKADVYLYATEPQRGYWTAWLLLAGVQPDDLRLLHVPVQLEPQLPARRAEVGGEPLAITAGVFWPWLQPASCLQSALAAMDQLQQGRCIVLGGRHPDHRIAGERYAELPAELRDHPRLTRHTPVPFAELTEGLTQCHLALDLYPLNEERRLSSSIRTAVYLWAGVPVVLGAWHYLASAVLSYSAGWVLETDDPDQLTADLVKILQDPVELERRSAGAQRLARERLVWKRPPAELLAFVEQPTRRKGEMTAFDGAVRLVDEVRRLRRVLADSEQERQALSEQLHDVQHELGSIRGRLLFRLDHRLRRLTGRSTAIPPRNKA